MNGPVNDNASTRKEPKPARVHPGNLSGEAIPDSHPSQRSETRRRWAEANRERIRESNRRWRAEHLERSRELNRESMRRAVARKRRQAERRVRGRERAKRWREAHPDRVRDYQRRWTAENRDKVREYYNRYYANHRDQVNARAADRRDADPDGMKASRKHWADRNKERLAELQRNRRSNPEKYQSELAANAAAKRLKRRLSAAGLPPKQLHPATAAERRTNERAAVAYFSDPERPEHLRQFTVLAESMTEHMLKHGGVMREFADAYSATRARLGLPPVPVENIMYGRAVEIVTERMRRVDLLTSRDVAAAVRSTKAAVQYEERKQQFERLVKSVVTVMHRDSARFVAEAELENRARAYQGKPRMAVDSLAVQIALREVLERNPTSRLSVEDVRSAGRSAKARVVLRTEVNADPRKREVQRWSVDSR